MTTITPGTDPPDVRRILVVDDEPDILQSMHILLDTSLENVEVFRAESGMEALEILGKESIDLLITDYKMPGMNGLDLLRKVREVLPGIAAILVTAFPDLDLAIKAINETRIDNFFTKPLDPMETLRVVEQTLERRTDEKARAQAFARAMAIAQRGQRPAPTAAAADPDEVDVAHSGGKTHG